jgi:hypothetical protein
MTLQLDPNQIPTKQTLIDQKPKHNNDVQQTPLWITNQLPKQHKNVNNNPVKKQINVTFNQVSKCDRCTQTYDNNDTNIEKTKTTKSLLLEYVTNKLSDDLKQITQKMIDRRVQQRYFELGNCDPKNSTKIEHLSTEIRARIIRDFIVECDNKHQIPYTKDDDLIKNQIFGIKNSKTCILTDTSYQVNVGDHMFPTLSTFKRTGRYGSSSLWNIIPITQRYNITYKRFKFNNHVKDIGYQELTDQEYKQCSKERQQLYDKFILWR